MKIYMDVCCLNRPFDDQTQERIRLESEAVLAILYRCQMGEWELVGSEAIDLEISKIPDDDKREKVEILYSIAKTKIEVDEEVEKRASELEKLNFKAFDALHVACAEKAGADVMLTTDDRLLRKAVMSKDVLKVKIDNPVNWIMEVFG